MKKCVVCMLILAFVLSLASCKSTDQNGQAPSSTPSAANDRSADQTEPTSSETNNISEYLTEEDGKQYLILPISKDKIRVSEKYMRYLDDIDPDLLKAAEEKISARVSQYSDNSGFYLQEEEGHLCLYAEVIVKIDPPASAGNVGGCGIDHEHMFFGERITK